MGIAVDGVADWVAAWLKPAELVYIAWSKVPPLGAFATANKPRAVPFAKEDEM